MIRCSLSLLIHCSLSRLIQSALCEIVKLLPNSIRRALKIWLAPQGGSFTCFQAQPWHCNLEACPVHDKHLTLDADPTAQHQVPQLCRMSQRSLCQQVLRGQNILYYRGNTVLQTATVQPLGNLSPAQSSSGCGSEACWCTCRITSVPSEYIMMLH